MVGEFEFYICSCHPALLMGFVKLSAGKRTGIAL